MIRKNTITKTVYTKIFELLEKNPNGLRWTDLLSKINDFDHNLHPKTVNGCIWKLIEKFPDQVYKPSRGVFRLLKYK